MNKNEMRNNEMRNDGMKNDGIKNTWTNQYQNHGMMWPAEPLIRMLKGRHYPNSELYAYDFKNASLLDVGCGDACNFPLYKQLGVKRICGVEITDEICTLNEQRLRQMDIYAEMKMGTNDNIPYKNNEFDILVSWNAGYYMGDADNYVSFDVYMKEFARILKNGGVFVFSIPKASHAIFNESIELNEGYAVIQKDALGIRKGIVFRKFRDQQDITMALSEYFYDIHIGSIQDDYFGTAAHWYIGYAKKQICAGTLSNNWQ